MSTSEIAGWLDENAGFLKDWTDNVHLPFPNKKDVNGNQCRAHIATGKSAARIIAEAAVNWRAQYVIWRKLNGDIIPSSKWDSYTGSIKSCRTETGNFPPYGLKTISPKVILATLQKEQSLITATGTYSTNPSAYNNPACCTSNQYKLAWAMGYGVPDSGGKAHRFKGFYSQVHWAAWQFRFNYERSAAKANANCDDKNLDNTQRGLCWDDVESITYGGPMTKGRYVRCDGCSSFNFSGYSTIDGQRTFVSNQATASLYYYTPHLNQSFPGIYSGWFGPTHIPTYRARLYGQSTMFGLKPGLRKRVFIAFRNIGSATWCAKDHPSSEVCPDGILPTVLAGANPLYRESRFNGLFDRTDKPKINFSQVLRSNGVPYEPEDTCCTHRVLPDQIAKFSFDMVAPMTLRGDSIAREWFEIVKMVSSTMGAGGDALLQVKIPNLDLEASNAGASGLRGAKPGWTLNTFVKIKNTGNVVWYDKTTDQATDWGVEYLTLSTAKPTGRSSIFGGEYESRRRATSVLDEVRESDGSQASNQHTVRPGETAVFRFTMTVPNRDPGLYTEWLGLRFAGAPGLVPAGGDIPLQIRILAD